LVELIAGAPRICCLPARHDSPLSFQPPLSLSHWERWSRAFSSQNKGPLLPQTPPCSGRALLSGREKPLFEKQGTESCFCLKGGGIGGEGGIWLSPSCKGSSGVHAVLQAVAACTAPCPGLAALRTSPGGLHVPGQSVPLCRRCRLQSKQIFIIIIFYVSVRPCPCSTPAPAGALAGSRCERALPPPPCSLGIPHASAGAPSPGQGLERPRHPLAAVVPTGLFPSTCVGCVPVLAVLPWPRPAPAVGAGLGSGEPGQTWDPCKGQRRGRERGDGVPHRENPESWNHPPLPPRCGREHISRKGLPPPPSPPHTLPSCIPALLLSIQHLFNY